MKSSKAIGPDGFPVECLKKGGMSVMEWLVRLLNVSFGGLGQQRNDGGGCVTMLGRSERIHGEPWCLYN